MLWTLVWIGLDRFPLVKEIHNKGGLIMTDKKIKQIVIDVEIEDDCVEVADFNIPKELDEENVEYILGSVLANIIDD